MATTTKRKRSHGKGSVYRKGTDPHYWIAYRVDGARYYESSGTSDKRRALARLAEIQRSIEAGTWVAPREREATGILTAERYLRNWNAGRVKAGVARTSSELLNFETFVFPRIGTKPLTDVKRSDILAIMRAVAEYVSEYTNKPLAPRSQLHVYGSLSTAFADAVRDELIAATPCTLTSRRGEIPQKIDHDPDFRRDAVFTRDEVIALISDPSLPIDRRVYYALGFLCGMRSGEIAGRRWRDIDATLTPLASIYVHSQITPRGEEKPTKTGDRRYVPIVPALSALLAEWREAWAMYWRRSPQPEDLIVPSTQDREGKRGRSETMLAAMRDDLATLKITRRIPAARHAMRATFLTLLEESGAVMAIARRTTHAPPRDVAGGYARYGWASICNEVGKLPIALPSSQPQPSAPAEASPAATVIDLAAAREASGVGYAVGYQPRGKAGKKARLCGDSDHSGSVDRRGSSRSSRQKGPAGSPAIVGNAVPAMQTATHVAIAVANLAALYLETTNEQIRSMLARSIVTLGGEVPEGGSL